MNRKKTKTEFQQYPIDKLLPHAAPMILIDEVLDYSEEAIICFVRIRTDSLFLNEQLQIPVWVGIEYMAQAIAAYAGITAINAGQAIQVGFLLGSRKYKAAIANFDLHDGLCIKAKKLYQEDSGLGVFDCCIERQLLSDSKPPAVAEIIVQGKINVFQPKHLEEFLTAEQVK